VTPGGRSLLPWDTGHPWPNGGASAQIETQRVVVLGWGNESRGDDGLGPALTRRIGALGLAHVTAIEDFQLQIEHAMDLEGAALALFLDASVAAAHPFSFTETGPREGLTHTSHAMAPEAVLDVFTRVLGQPPPPAFVLAIRGDAFELGTGLGEAAAERLEAAWGFVRPLLEAPDAATWRARVTAGRPGG
jgi:hydrogenase maturation protease